jgi:hypothetical protein
MLMFAGHACIVFGFVRVQPRCVLNAHSSAVYENRICCSALTFVAAEMEGQAG